MSISIKGFCQISDYTSNVENIVSTIGELSSFANTFSRDIKYYQNSISTNLSTAIFSCLDTGAVTLPPLELQNIINTVCSWIYTSRQSSTTIQTQQQFITALNNQFTGNINTVSCGNIIQSNNNKSYPEWVSFSKVGYTGGSTIKIWFSNASFIDTYDEYKIIIVPPITTIDDFFLPAAGVRTAVNSVTETDKMLRIETARNRQPESFLVSIKFDYNNPLNANDTVPTYWSAIIYGTAGNDDDIIRQAIIDYIASHTTHTVAEWTKILPEIYTRTEYTIYPRWHKYSIENNVIAQTGIYSNVVDPLKEIAWLKTNRTDLTNSFIEQYVRFMPNPYKSLMLLVISGSGNRNDNFDISLLYPDIINVSSTSVDFNRMTMRTQGWLTILAQAIYIAETADQYTDVPIGLRKVLRNGITYITFVYDNIQFLVSCKSTTPDYI